MTRPALAVFSGALIGTLGGLIGLGGAEFRLPVLVRAFGYAPRGAVVVNLAVSLVTVTAALMTRASYAATLAIGQLLDVVLGMAAGGMLGAQLGVRWMREASDERLGRMLRRLLYAIGALLLIEGCMGMEAGRFLVPAAARVPVALALGVAIGVVSSLLGVAGGEMIIPSLVLVFGLGIKAAGTASLAISTPVILVGLWKHRAWDALAGREDLGTVILPMGLGSIAGAVAGAALAPHLPGEAVKIALGFVLVMSASNVFHVARETTPSSS